MSLTNPTAVKRLELYAVAAVILLGLGWLALHVHNDGIAQQALFKQQQRQTTIDQKAADAKLAAIQTQVDGYQKEFAAQADQNAQLAKVLSSLGDSLDSLKQQERQQVAQVQSMTTNEVLAALSKQLGVTGASYNQSTSTVTGVTPDVLKKVETQATELTSCQSQNANLSEQVATSQKLAAGKDQLISTLQQTVEADKSTLTTTKASDQEQIKTLQAQVKVVRGSFLHRVWNKVKAPLMFGVGVAVGRGL